MISDLKDIMGLSLLLRRTWQKRTTIVILLLATLLGCMWILYKVDLSQVPRQVTRSEGSILLILLLSLFLVWLITRRPQRTKSGKIGIAIAINCETKKERHRLRTDFVEALRDEI